MRLVIDAEVGAGLDRLIAERALHQQVLAEADVEQLRLRMEEARARRLQPHYVRAFFLEAFRLLGGRIAERESGRGHARPRRRTRPGPADRSRRTGGAPLRTRVLRVGARPAAGQSQGRSAVAGAPAARRRRRPDCGALRNAAQAGHRSRGRGRPSRGAQAACRPDSVEHRRPQPPPGPSPSASTSSRSTAPAAQPRPVPRPTWATGPSVTTSGRCCPRSSPSRGSRPASRTSRSAVRTSRSRRVGVRRAPLSGRPFPGLRVR